MMPRVLKLLELPQGNGMSQVEVRRRGINTKFYSKRPPLHQLQPQFGFADDLRAVSFQKFYRVVRRFHSSRKNRCERWPRFVLDATIERNTIATDEKCAMLTICPP